MWWMVTSYVLGFMTAIGLYLAWIEWEDYQWRVRHDENNRRR